MFIGQGLKHDFIQRLLDKCLLTDEEMELGVEKWRETMEDLDRIKLGFNEAEIEEEDEDEEEDGDGDESPKKKQRTY